MIELYHGSGAGDFSILQDGLTHDQCRILFDNAARLLAARSQTRAAEILRSTPFRVVDATNHFNDEFSVLYAVLPLDKYERLRRGQEDPTEGQAYQQIAGVFSELSTYIRFIAVELALDRPVHPDVQHGLGLKQSEINKLVYKYIGVSGGYLANFSYRSHHEFYIELDLDINPYDYEGTTRERFIKILSESAPHVQARILEGILDRFLLGSTELRTKERATEIRVWITRLRTGPHVEQPALRITSEVVERALLDAQELLRATGATSGVDRVHTALHGYMREVCRSAGLPVAEDASLTELFKQIREEHPAFNELGPRSDDILRVLRALSTILDSFNPLRNKASVAHPNAALLPEPEAMLVINTARSVLHYIDEKVYRHGNANKTEEASAAQQRHATDGTSRRR
ncbi:MAG: abortive infection family protein [Candidatus Aminicenantes bacterium]|nr:abortive infection family protein [Candidatus Aminicenantes bacterium]